MKLLIVALIRNKAADLLFFLVSPQYIYIYIYTYIYIYIYTYNLLEDPHLPAFFLVFYGIYMGRLVFYMPFTWV